MELTLNIFLLVAFFCVTCSSTDPKRTETQTTEADGTIKTVITEEWEEEKTIHKGGRGHGRGRGHGDTIVIMTNDNDDVDNHHHDQHDSGSINERTAVLNRLYREKDTDYHYSVDPQEQTSLTNNGYKPDGSLGRIVPKLEDFLECTHLVPIVRISHDVMTSHGLVVTAAVYEFINVYKWKDTGIIGYGVLEKGQCGANLAVRSMWKSADWSYFFQSTSDSEYKTYSTLGYSDYGWPTFYIWGEGDNFSPQPRPAVIEDKTALLTRMYSDKQTDFTYVTSQQEQDILAKEGYKFDANMGYVAKTQSAFTECTLVPIVRISHDVMTSHGLVVTAIVNEFINTYKWKDTGIIGYGVLQKGQCGANLAVRNMWKSADWSYFFQTISDPEYKLFSTMGYSNYGWPVFYIWEA